MIERKTDVFISGLFMFIHSRFLANKGIFIDSKQKVAKVTGIILASTVGN